MGTLRKGSRLLKNFPGKNPRSLEAVTALFCIFVASGEKSIIGYIFPHSRKIRRVLFCPDPTAPTKNPFKHV